MELPLRALAEGELQPVAASRMATIRSQVFRCYEDGVSRVHSCDAYHSTAAAVRLSLSMTKTPALEKRQNGFTGFRRSSASFSASLTRAARAPSWRTDQDAYTALAVAIQALFFKWR